MSQNNQELIVIDPMSVDQLAGAVVLILGAVGSLLLVIWQSKCHCKVNLCYIFSCERRPGNEEEMKGLKDQKQKLKDKVDLNKDKDNIQSNKDKDINAVINDEQLIPKTKSNISLVSMEELPKDNP